MKKAANDFVKDSKGTRLSRSVKQSWEEKLRPTVQALKLSLGKHTIRVSKTGPEITDFRLRSASSSARYWVQKAETRGLA